jgi:elongation factor 3
MLSQTTDIQNLSSLIKATQAQTTTDARRSQANSVAEEVKAVGIVAAFRDGQLIKTITTLLDNKKQAPLRETAYLILAAVSKAAGQAGEPYLIPLVPRVLDGYADKVVSVREAASEASKAIMALPSRYAVKLLLPVLFDSIENGRWQSQCGSLQLLTSLSKSSPKVMGRTSRNKYIVRAAHRLIKGLIERVLLLLTLSLVTPSFFLLRPVCLINLIAN